MEENVVFSITAHIDLLGFSSHLILSSYDLRTKIGEEAIQRLKILEDAVDLVEKERSIHPEYYPETFRYFRFNDSLMLGIDIRSPIIPAVGKPNEAISYSYLSLKKFFGSDNEDGGFLEKYNNHFSQEAFKAAQFVGIVSRIHNYINKKEFSIHMAGCRTIVSSGLRYRFISKEKGEDFYSANFSLANAYIVNDLGSKSGFSGNRCYIENNVASICGHDKYVKRTFGYLKLIGTDLPIDPFNGRTDEIMKSDLKYVEAKKIEVDLFNKRYVFRELNTVSAANLQLFPKIIDEIEDENADEKNVLLKALKESLSEDTSSIVTDKNGSQMKIDIFKHPFLMMTIALDTDVDEAFETISEIQPLN